MSQKFYSFPKRLTRRVVFAVLAVMGIIAAIIFVTSMRMIVTETQGRYFSIMHTINEKIEKVLLEYVVSMRNVRSAVEHNLDSPEQLKHVLMGMMELNPNMLGYCAAFEPDYFPQQGRWFEPYVYSSGKGGNKKVHYVQIGSVHHDYLKADWYQKGMNTEIGLFVEPYYDPDGAKDMVVSYVLPIRDQTGRKIGVLGSDVSWEWLRRKMNKIELKSNKSGLIEIDEDDNTDLLFDTFVIGPTGNFILHWGKTLNQHDNYFTYAKATRDTIDDRVGRLMIERKEGTATMEVNGKRSFVIYRPIKYTNWSMAMVVPEKALYAPGLVIGVIILICIFIGLQIIYWICKATIRRATHPLHALAKSADEVAKGNFNAPLPELRYNDEIRLLRDSFGNMQESLGLYVEQLKVTTAEKASIENELSIANEIQMSMLPQTFPERSDVSIYGTLKPARAVGGDLFDYFFRDGKLFFCIGDVVGKGVSAALLMTVTKSLYRAYSAHEDMPENIISKINHLLSEYNDVNLYVTFFAGVLDLQSGRMRYCSAGHEPPVLIGDDATMLPYIPGFSIGCFSDTDYQAQEVVIEPNTTLFLFTDGLTEANDGKGHMFERERMMDVARQAIGEGCVSPRPLIETMTKAVTSFVGEAEQSDDLTMLAIQRLSSSTLIMKASEAEYPRMKTFLKTFAESVHLSDYEAGKMRLGIEEGIGNIIDYSGATEIILCVGVSDGQLRVTITDDGRPFDPTKVPEPDLDVSGEDRQVGGLGIMFMRQMSDSFTYRREENRNILFLNRTITNENAAEN